VEDASLMLGVMSGPDPRDPLSLPEPLPDFSSATRRSISGLRIAYDRTFGGFPVEERVATAVDDAVGAFEVAGATVEPVELKLPRSHDELSQVWRRGVSVYYAHMLRYMEAAGITPEGYRDLLTDDFVEYVTLGERLTATEYRADDVIRTAVLDMLVEVLTNHDLLVTPTVAVAGVRNADDRNTRGPLEINGVAVDPMIGWVLTFPVNFVGLPAVSLPAGWTQPEGLPIGMQLIGRRYDEETVIAASAAFERVLPWQDRYRALVAVPELAARA